MKKAITIIFCLLICYQIKAQAWMEPPYMVINNATDSLKLNNFYEIQKAFNLYEADFNAFNQNNEDEYEIGGKEGKFAGYAAFKRWEYLMESRVYPSGNLSLIGTTWSNYKTFLNEYNSTNEIFDDASRSTNWTAMGPFGRMCGVDDGGKFREAGRYNFITHHPTNPNTYWVGSPNGGLWKTTDNGTTWNTPTDNLSVIGCTDMEIDPTNPNIMYLSTGDSYSSFIPSIGVLKSIDGGLNWNPTGLSYTAAQQKYTRKILINPINPLSIMVATKNGIYKNSNGGTGAWTQITVGNTTDLEFKPGDTNIVYAGETTRLMRSTDGGLSFLPISSGIPTWGGRTEIAVTPANPNYVYVIKSYVSGGWGVLQGVYRSVDSGVNFTPRMTTPNILSNECVTLIADGQGTYDLTIVASPTNAELVTVGGIQPWQSVNGGTTFSIIGCSHGVAPIPGIHADQHDLEYNSAGTLYIANDGGIWEYADTAWIQRTGLANISMIYRIGLSSISPNKWITGHMDNGTNIYNNGNYCASLGSDGMDCFIDRTNDQHLLGCRINGALYESVDGGHYWNPSTFGANGPGDWITPWKQDPQIDTKFWLGKDIMYSSTDIGILHWIPCGALPGSNAAEFVKEFAVAPSNNQYLYVIHGTTGMYTSTDGGISFTQSNVGYPVGSALGSSVEVSNTNPLVALVTFSGYSSGKKVYKTTTGGASWFNVSGALPNIPANCIVVEPGNINNRIYIGMDLGVYYTDDLAGGVWTIYNAGLPNVIVSDMEISPAAPNKIRAATFGRGVYSVDIVPNPAPPVTAFNYVGNICSMPDTLFMNDNSSNSPNSWNWTVSPAAGVTINSPSSQNPTISFTNPGSYTISLTPTNSFGTGPIINQVVEIGQPSLTITPSSATVCQSQPMILTGSGANMYVWQPGNQSGSVANYSPLTTQTYTVTGTGLNGCTSTDTITIPVIDCTGVIKIGDDEIPFAVFPNPSSDYLNIFIHPNQELTLELKIVDIMGKIVMSESGTFSSEKTTSQLNLFGLARGAYFLVISGKDLHPHLTKIIKE